MFPMSNPPLLPPIRALLSELPIDFPSGSSTAAFVITSIMSSPSCFSVWLKLCPPLIADAKALVIVPAKSSANCVFRC